MFDVAVVAATSMNVEVVSRAYYEFADVSIIVGAGSDGAERYDWALDGLFSTDLGYYVLYACGCLLLF